MLRDMGRNRAHWEAVGRAFAEDARLRVLDAARLTPEERMRIGFEMGASIPEAEAARDELDRRGATQAQLHERWRALQAKRAGQP